MPRFFRIDPNDWRAGDGVPARLFGVAPAVGEVVIAYESEECLEWDAIVRGVLSGFVMLDVAAGSLRDFDPEFLDAVDEWHCATAGSVTARLELREFLGLSLAEYSKWVER